MLPSRPADPGRLPGATRARPWPPGIRSSPLVGRLGPGQELGVGRCPLGSWSLLCSRPAPTGEGRRGRSGGCAGEASGGLGPGSGLSWGPGFLPAFQPGPALWVPLGAQNWSFLFPHGFESALLDTLAYPLLVVLWGAERNDQPSNWGRVSHFAPARASVFIWVKWGQEGTQPLRVLVNSGRELVHGRSVKCQQVTFDETDPGTS